MVIMRDRPEEAIHYRAFRAMNETYFAAFQRGEREAVAQMVDFYGGPGTFASWPERVRGYAADTAAVNILDWQTAYAFPLTAEFLATLDLPSLVLWGAASHPAARRANALLGQSIPGAATGTVEGAAHFMIATHAAEVAARVAEHIGRSDSARG